MQALFRAESQSFLSVPRLQLTKSAALADWDVAPMDVVDAQRESLQELRRTVVDEFTAAVRKFVPVVRILDRG